MLNIGRDNLELEEKLIAIMKEEFLSPSPEFLDNPEFDKAGRVHDWRNYIPEALEKIWDELSRETKIVAFLIADSGADKEDWD